MDFLEILFERVVVAYHGVHLFLEVEAPDLQRLLVKRRVIFPSLLAASVLVRDRHLLQLHFESLGLTLQSFLLFFEQFARDVTGCRIER